MVLRVLLTNTTWWPTAARMAIALRDLGCEVMALCPKRGHSLAVTTAVTRCLNYRGMDPVGCLRQACDSSKPDVIIPCDDAAVQHLHELHHSLNPSEDTLRTLIERSIGSPDSYSVTGARNALMTLATSLGLRIPDSAPVSDIADLRAFAEGHPFPWVLKIDGTYGGLGVKIVGNIREAEETFKKISFPLSAASAVKRYLVDRDPYWIRPWVQRIKPTVTVQSYIDGRPANSAVAVVSGKVVAVVALEVVGALSATSCSSVVRVVENRQMIEASERIASHLKLSGFYGFDFMIENQTGLAYLIEMNPRCTPICHLHLGPGRDLAEAFCTEFSGMPVQRRPRSTSRDTIAYFPKAWHWNAKSELLRTSFHDVPWEEPGLIEDLIRIPWPDRGILAKVSNRFRHKTFEERAAQGVLYNETGQPATVGSAKFHEEYRPIGTSCEPNQPSIGN